MKFLKWFYTQRLKDLRIIVQEPKDIILFQLPDASEEEVRRFAEQLKAQYKVKTRFIVVSQNVRILKLKRKPKVKRA